MSPFLKTGTVGAFHQSDGTSPLSREVGNIFDRTGESSSAAMLSIKQGQKPCTFLGLASVL